MLYAGIAHQFTPVTPQTISTSFGNDYCDSFVSSTCRSDSWEILTLALLALGTVLALAYVLAHLRAHRQGIRFSKQKVFLVVSTGLCSIYSWGLNSWGEAFFIMNLFHAVQYLALVWATEKKQLQDRIGGRKSSKARTALLFFGPVAAYGFVAQSSDPDLNGLWTLTIVVSLMHFWYDSFIWSVQKQQV